MEGNIVTVRQDGKPENVAEDALRKGDILLLQAGDLVAADLKLVEARGLEIDEWELTGEIVPVAKRVDDHAEVYVYRGSKVTRGSGSGVVIATGEETEYAQCVKQSWERMRYRRPRLFTRGSLVVLVLLAPPFVLAAVRHENGVVLGLLAAALAVLAVVLENSALFDYVATRKELSRIEQQGIRIRDVGALEVMERINVVCLDKTGVLTTRELRVREIYLSDSPCDLAYFAGNEEAATLVRTGCALCNDVVYAEKANLAAPIDRALIAFARANGTDIAEAHQSYCRVYDKPFDSEERYMACGFESGQHTVFFAKGDPDVVLKMCGTYSTLSGSEQRLDMSFWQSTRDRAELISKAGDVVLALAYGVGGPATPPLHYTFLCLIQLENPLQPNVPVTLRALRGEGIRTVMLTGDRTETALKIAVAAGIASDERLCLTGRLMAQMGAFDIREQASLIPIFARLLPSQKALVVRLLQQKNKVVAMVGDGANDTLALKAADVGIAFGSDASPLAKRVSPILINDLPDLVTLVQETRRITERLGDIGMVRAAILITMFLGLYGLAISRYALIK